MLLLKYALLVGLCVWALWVQWTYRVPGSAAFVLLPWVGTGLASLTLLLLLGRLARRAPADDWLRRVIDGVELADGLLILAFCFYSLYLFTNARWVAPMSEGTQASEVVAIGGGEPDAGITAWYGWADLRSWRQPGATDRLLLYDHERRQLWGGQPVIVHVRHGAFRPWVAGIEPDEDQRLLNILKVSPNASRVWKDLVNARCRHRRYDEALAAGLEYLKIFPGDEVFAVRLAGEFFSADRWPSAVPLLEPFLQRKPSFEVYRYLGFAMTRANRQAEGVELIKKSIAMKPDEWWSHYVLAYAYFYNSEFSAAVPWFEKVLELRPNFPEIEERLRTIRAGTARPQRGY
jgi:hypothetical protein